MAEAPMMKRKRSCSALHLFVDYVAKSGANVSTGRAASRAMPVGKQGRPLARYERVPGRGTRLALQAEQPLVWAR